MISNPNHYKVLTRTQEMSGAFVKSFVFKNWNPFVEAGPAGFIFLPIATPEPRPWTSSSRLTVGAAIRRGIRLRDQPQLRHSR